MPLGGTPLSKSTIDSCDGAGNCVHGMAEGETTEKQRNKLLAQMTDEVAARFVVDG